MVMILLFQIFLPVNQDCWRVASSEETITMATTEIPTKKEQLNNRDMYKNKTKDSSQ